MDVIWADAATENANKKDVITISRSDNSFIPNKIIFVFIIMASSSFPDIDSGKSKISQSVFIF